MTATTRTAGVNGTWTYTLTLSNGQPLVPVSLPTVTLYSDPAMTVVALAAQVAAPGALPNQFLLAYPSTLPAGTYYQRAASVLTAGQPAWVDADDTVTFVSAAGGVGDPHYFDVAALRALPQMNDTVKYPDAALALAQARIEALIERMCDTSFVWRGHTEVVDGSPYGAPVERWPDPLNPGAGYTEAIIVSDPYPQQVTALSQNGTAFTGAQLAALDCRPGGLIQPVGYTGPGITGLSVVGPWLPGRRNITVTYLAGYTLTCPPDLSAAALTAARAWLLTTYGASGIPDRALSLANEAGNVRLATPQADRYPTGLPEVDAVIMGWAEQVKTVGAA